MPGTLADLKTRIEFELGRDDLTDAIADAINDAIAVYQKERFRFSDITPNAPPTFNTVAGRYIYTSADNANISTMMGIDYVNADIGTAAVIGLLRMTPEDIKLYNLPSGQIMGQPDSYAYEGNMLLLAPIPDKVYLITLGVFRQVAAPATDAEANNPWMVDGERLIRARAKYEIATHVTRNPKIAQAMSPSPPAENGGVVGAAYREWKSLKAEAARITGTGRVRAMRF